MPGKYKSEELRKLIVEAKQRGESAAHEVAESKSGPEPHRASLGSFEAPCPWKNVYQQDRVVSHAPRRMEPHPSGHAQRPRGVYAEKNEGRDQVKGLPNKILSVFLVLLHCFCSLFIVLSC